MAHRRPWAWAAIRQNGERRAARPGQTELSADLPERRASFMIKIVGVERARRRSCNPAHDRVHRGWGRAPVSNKMTHHRSAWRRDGMAPTGRALCRAVGPGLGPRSADPRCHQCQCTIAPGGFVPRTRTSSEPHALRRGRLPAWSRANNLQAPSRWTASQNSTRPRPRCRQRETLQPQCTNWTLYSHTLKCAGC